MENKLTFQERLDAFRTDCLEYLRNAVNASPDKTIDLLEKDDNPIVKFADDEYNDFVLDKVFMQDGNIIFDCSNGWDSGVYFYPENLDVDTLCRVIDYLALKNLHP